MICDLFSVSAFIHILLNQLAQHANICINWLFNSASVRVQPFSAEVYNKSRVVRTKDH